MAACAWLILVLGYTQRKHRERHIPLMLTGIFMDIGLVLYLQLTRDALRTAFSFTLPALRQLHVTTSSVAFVLYFPVLVTGWRLGTGTAREPLRRLHIRLATLALCFRTLGFVLMFSMWRVTATAP